MAKGIIKLLINIKDEILDIIYPEDEHCITCGANGFIGICPLCESKIKIDRENNIILSYGQYGGVLKKLILRFKYKSDFSAGKVLAKLMIKKIKMIDYYPDIILYVPINKSSKKKRGYNQCEFLATELSKKLDVECRDSIKKVRETKEQKRLSFQERQLNILDSFRLDDTRKLCNKKILIIDDVVTTGATLIECLKLVNEIKDSEIKLLTVARSRL